MTNACTDNEHSELNEGKLHKAFAYVERLGVSTVLITGRGEPTLYFEKLLRIVELANEYNMIVELQTNGVAPYLEWTENEQIWQLQYAGLDTIAISLASLDRAINNNIMRCSTSFDVTGVVAKLSKFFTTRVTYMLSRLNGPEIKTSQWFVEQIMAAQILGAKQITFRTIGTSAECNNKKVVDWINKYADKQNYSWCFDEIGTNLWDFDWNGRVYDVSGMSVCISDCLDDRVEIKQPRSFIFDGQHLRYSWQYKGALIF